MKANLPLALALTLTLAPSIARADAATPQALFDAATKLFESGDYAKACPMFAESQRQGPALGTMVAVAYCYKKAGRNASAWAAYKDLSFEAKKRGDTVRAEAAEKEANAMEQSLSKLQITAADANTPGLTIRRDGEDVGKAVLGTAIPVDPGAHVIEATAPGYEVWQTTVTVGPNRDSKSVLIPALQKKEAADAGAAAPAGGGEAPNTMKRNIGFVVGGVGIASLGVGAVLGIMALGDSGDAKDDSKLCGTDKACTAAGRDKIESASTKALVSTITLGVGVAAVGTGVFLVLTSRGSRKPAPASARLVPLVGPQGGGISLSSSF